MKKLSILLSIVLFTSLSGCKKSEPPIVNFTFTSDGYQAQCSVLFTNTTKDGETFHWDFGDGQTSGDENPAAHLYTNGGTYSVTLTSTNEHGTSSKTHSVLIQNAPAPTQVRISKIVLTAFPSDDGGSVWDVGSNPDTEIEVSDASFNVISGSHGNYFSNASQSDLPITWNYSTAFLVSSWGTNYNVDVYDNDTVGREYMGSSPAFKIDNYTSGSNAFPSSITLNGGTISCQIFFQWQ
jgi:PKD repeat protein